MQQVSSKSFSASWWNWWSKTERQGKKIPNLTDLCWSLVRSRQRALIWNCQYFLGTPLNSDEGTKVMLLCWGTPVLLLQLVTVRNAYKLWMLNLDFRQTPEVGWWALSYKGGIFVSLGFVYFTCTTASFWYRQGKISKSWEMKYASWFPLAPVAQSETAFISRRWQLMVLLLYRWCSFCTNQWKALAGSGFSLSCRSVGMVTLQ